MKRKLLFLPIVFKMSQVEEIFREEKSKISVHASRKQFRTIPENIIEGLKLTPEQVKAMYISDYRKFENGEELVQLHYKAEIPESIVKQHRGWVIKVNAPTSTEKRIRVVARSYDWTDPIVAERIPESLPGDKYTISKQGFLARVYNVNGNIFIGTHRKIDSANSKFGESKPMKEMFLEACALKGLDVSELFNTYGKSIYCHLFFVTHKDLQLINSDQSDLDISYMGSYKRQMTSWIDLDEEDDDNSYKCEFMEQSDPQLSVLEKHRVKYLNVKEADNLFSSGTPIVRWRENEQPVRIVPTQWDRKEKIRGSTPNLKLVWYTLLDEGKQDSLLEVTPASLHSTINSWYDEMLNYLDITSVINEECRVDGPEIPSKGTLTEYLVNLKNQYVKCPRENKGSFMRELDPVFAEEVLEVSKYVASYIKNHNDNATKFKRFSEIELDDIAANFIRNRCYSELPGEQLYRLYSKFLKRKKSKKQTE